MIVPRSIVCLALVACVGNIDDAPLDPWDPTSPEGRPVEPADHFADQRVRRLTEAEYIHSVQALFGDDVGSVVFPSEAAPNGYDNSARGLRVESVLAQNLWQRTGGMASAGATRLLTNSGCGEAECARTELLRVAAEAYRRPLDADEERELGELFDLGLDGGSPEEGLALGLRVVLQSPAFLYRSEIGAPEGERYRLDSYEVATLLAYTLSGAPPDEELLALAAGDGLDDPSVRRAQGERLLALPGSREVVARFGRQWLEVDHLDVLTRDRATYGEWEDVRDLLQAEAGDFMAEAVLEEDAGVEELFTADWSVGDARLAEFYGAREEGGRLLLPEGQRGGVLTQGGVLAHLAQSVLPSPVQRGHFVRTRILCQTIPDPPDGLNVVPPDPDPSRTNREQWELNTSDETCAGCHARMNPIGFAFESFDAIGRYREVDNGVPVDTTGELTGTDVDGPFESATELSQRLAGSDVVRSCFVSQVFEYALGARPSAERARALEVASPAFMEGASVRELLLDLVAAEAFVVRVPEEIADGESEE